MEFYFASDVGLVRKNNEDYCKCEIVEVENEEIGLFAIADGMGGYKKGEVASKMAAENIILFLKENLLQTSKIKIEYIDDILKQAYNNVNSLIFEKAEEDESFSGMGTTLTTAILYKNYLYVANVGDSRGYVYSEENGLRRITRDHSYVEELVESNEITEEEALTHPNRSIITRAIGPDPFVIVDIFKQNIEKSDIILLATDGLTGCIIDSKIEEIIKENEDFEDMSDELIDTANNAGNDNVSVILVRV
ncbi:MULTISPECIES: Stp1/IreP family PP2C-type Ser/Thr phosphatase [Peptacetobacter]|uniref:Stp1/IreP family PP2C-type Ser/Thr phosphatase n=1 Tax=Peptacetobacter TaxID=2743582 RepID=UPI001916D00D|nr:Stp1/IreP family PP2C-type Ser/Thr phosphatase [Peptacetobacter hiranonis]MEE0248663.1 Stp1/IreP family PP2C-type Ser/Thr phosphatase [Peptacetobacter hiranonis]QQQ85994.1 Stp1/IreP family PP2C-type Ser/Thr phosphatase [Peptacetobacter hiranonis]